MKGPDRVPSSYMLPAAAGPVLLRPSGLDLVRPLQLVILPADPVYCRPTPHELWPCLRKPVSSMTSTASGEASVSTAYSRTRSRRASASQWLRPSTAYWRHGPGSPAASARIQPVLRRSGPSNPSRKAAAEAATLG